MTTPLAGEILKAGIDDWVPLLAIEGLARLQGASSQAQAREAALGAVEELATAGLVQIGEVSNGGFFAWQGSVEDALAHARSIWEATDRDHWGFALWVANTAAGDEAARRLVIG